MQNYLSVRIFAKLTEAQAAAQFMKQEQGFVEVEIIQTKKMVSWDDTTSKVQADSQGERFVVIGRR